MIKEKSWEEFREAGLLWLINSILHLFGWAIVYKCDDGKIKSVYPARVRYRGFNEESNAQGYMKVTEYLQQNIEELSKESKE